MKTLLERLHINKNTGKSIPNDWYILLGIYEGFDYLCNEFGDTMIAGDKGSGPSIFIVQYNDLLKIDKEYFDDGSIFVWEIPQKYQNNIDQFENDYYVGKINLDDDCVELNEDELNKLLKK